MQVLGRSTHHSSIHVEVVGRHEVKATFHVSREMVKRDGCKCTRFQSPLPARVTLMSLDPLWPLTGDDVEHLPPEEGAFDDRALGTVLLGSAEVRYTTA